MCQEIITLGIKIFVGNVTIVSNIILWQPVVVSKISLKDALCVCSNFQTKIFKNCVPFKTVHRRHMLSSN
jgi:hypothetical protein